MSISNEVLSFGEAFDWYVRVIYDAEAITEGVASTLRRHSAERVLDCAAGSGLPALQLHRKYGGDDGLLRLGQGTEAPVELVCSDGSQTMVDQFNRNAKCMGLDVRCDLVDWNDLTADDKYDFVLCRGNSLVYALSWDGGTAVPDLSALETYVDAFASVLHPGGHLQIDAPRHLDLQPEIKQATRSYEHVDASVEVIEKVTETGYSRQWDCTVNVRPHVGCEKTLSFALHSARVTIDDVEKLLESNHFKTVERFQLDGDRPGHMTILAQLMER